MEEKIENNCLECPVFVPPKEDEISVSIETSTNDAGFKECIKNIKPQLRSVSAGALIFVASGMSLSYGVFDDLAIQWSIGGILGAVFSALVAKFTPKKALWLLGGSLVAISGLLTLISLNYFASVVSGMAAGISFIPTFAAISEHSDANIRGLIASSVDSICFSLGICLEMLINMFFLYGQSPYIGWVNFFFGLGAIRLAYIWSQESPIWYLQQEKEEQAIEAQTQLQTTNDETSEKMLEHKRYIERNNLISLKESATHGLDALIKISFLRILITLALSKMVYLCHEPGSIAVRLLGAVIGACIVDPFGRLSSTCVASLLSALFAFAVAVSWQFHSYALNLTLLAFYQLGVGISASTTAAYMSEAFPLQVKSYFYAVIFSLEQIVQISLASAYCGGAKYAYFYILAILGVIAFYAVKKFMPETKRTQLLEAQQKFAENAAESGKHIAAKIGFV